MPERLRFEFGVPYFYQQRIESASEAIKRSFVYKFADTNEAWDETEGFFPEYSHKISEIRSVINRRKSLLSFSNPETSASSLSHAAGILENIHRITKFPYTFESAVILNRLFPDALPEFIDDSLAETILKEADDMSLETNGIVREEGRLADFIALVLEDKVRLSPHASSEASLQIELGL